MRKSTFLLLAVTAMLISASAWCEQQPTNDDVAMAPANPLMQLPGMRNSPIPSGRIGSPVTTMPTVTAALPAPIVSDYTNYPNPFDSRKENTVIAYTLNADSKTTLTLYDLFGKEVRSWNFSAGSNGGKTGSNTVAWDGTNETGRKVAKGGYIAQLETESPQGNATALRKIGVIH